MSERALFPLMLTVVRESRKMSQTVLAKAAGLSQSAISQIETGRITPSAAVVEKLAEPLHCPPSLLQFPLLFRQLPVTFFRKKARVGVKDVGAIRARVNLYRLRVEILLRSYDLLDAQLVLADTKAEGISASEVARRLRVYWNVPPGPIGDLTTLVESHGILVIPMEFGNAAVDGLSLYEPNDTLPPMIFMNNSVPGDRWRLSLAHELGHIVLHHHLRIPRPPDQVEREAFEFGAEFLAPAREVSGQLRRVSMHRLAALKIHWRVSMASLLMRADKMGHISDRQARRLWIQLRQGGMKEPVEIVREKPTALETIVRYHMGDLGYSTADLSKALHQWPGEFRADFNLSSARLRLE